MTRRQAPLLLTSAALVSFAGNSILSRLALGDGAIDAATFSTIRLSAGACVLLGAVMFRSARTKTLAGSWIAASFLFLYVIPFSFAYNSLTTGTGALILFGAVQSTMLAAALGSGERPRAAQWLGLLLALTGLIYLLLPGLAAPPLIGCLLMVVAGMAWGVYSLLGRGAADPLAATAGNFLRAMPLAVVVSLLARSTAQAEPRGVILAATSGAITSGLGYVMWYAALRHLSATRAALVQLVVPIFAAAGGVIFMNEALTRRLAIASILVLGGIAIATRPPAPSRRS